MKNSRNPQYVKCWVENHAGIMIPRWGLLNTKYYIPFIGHDVDVNNLVGGLTLQRTCNAVVFENPEIPKIDKVCKEIINQIKKEK